MKSFKKVVIASISGVLLVLGGADIAHADTAYVSGQLNTSGALVKYDYTRTHQFTGPISLHVTDMPSGVLRLGLRNMKKSGGPQFGDSLQWNRTGTKAWDDILVGTRFAFQGRMLASGIFLDNTWGGDLTY